MFNIILLGITSLLTDISSEMVYPILPIYLVSRLGAGPAIMGVIEGFAESLASLLKVFSGHFSDRINKRKPFTIAGYACSSAGKVFLYLAGAWSAVFAGRLIDRFGKGIRTAPRDALIAESSNSGSRGASFGLHRMMDTLGASSGVLIAYLIIRYYSGDMKQIFLFSLIPAAAAVLFLFFVKEPPRRSAQASAPLRFSWGVLDKRLKLFLIFSFIFSLGNSSNQFLLLRVQKLGNPIGRVLLLYLFYNIVYAAVSYPASRLSDKIGRKNILVSGYLLYGLVYIGFALNSSPGNFWLLFGVYGLYMGFTEGTEKALVVDIAPQQARATALGLHATLVGLGLLPASLLAGLLWKYFGAAVPFYFGGLMATGAAVCLWFILKED